MIFFSVKIDSILYELKYLKSQNTKLSFENIRFSNEVGMLQINIDIFIQRNARYSFEIKGIPKTQNENCLDIIQTVTKKDDSDVIINSMYRINTTKNNSGILVVEINSVEMKNDFIGKNKIMKMNAKMIVNN